MFDLIFFWIDLQVVNPRLLEMVKKGGNGLSRGKFNQRGGGSRPNGGGMNDFRNRSQQMSNGGFGNRPTSRFSSAQNGNSSYQPRPYNGIAGNQLDQLNQAQKSAYGARSTPSNYPPKTGSHYDSASANGSLNQSRPSSDPSKYAGFQSKSTSASIIPNVYGQQPHQSYPSVMASLYSLPPPALPQFNAVQSVQSFSYPPPVLPVKN